MNDEMKPPGEGEGSRPNVGEETVFDGSVEPMALGASATYAAEKRSRFKGGERRILPKLKPGVAFVVVAALIVAFAFVPMLASSLKKTPKDKVGISYGGGPIEGAHFQKIVLPGSSLFFNGWFDPLYLYPADQQNYIVAGPTASSASSSSSNNSSGNGSGNGSGKGSGNSNSGSSSASSNPTAGSTSTVSGQPIVAPSKNRVQVTYQAAVYYKLNIDKLRAFHEEFGLKYNAYTQSGWRNLIQDTLRQQIENALLEQTRRYDVDDIYGNVDVLLKIQKAVQDTLSQRLRLAMGDDYFCSPTYDPGKKCGHPTFVVKSIDIPPSIVTAYEANRSSGIGILTRQNEAEQRRIEAEGVKVLDESLGQNGNIYALLRAIEQGKTQFWVVPDSSGLNLPTQGGSTGAPATPGAGG
ncbi:MAG: hypothetical protein KDB02_09175 [Acidimicrobiales bacterium]|nr:hypothetical protein [Acidimicrobiales bacterium]